MARTVVLNGSSYSIPEPNETGYGAALTSYLVALGAAFPQLGGAASLLSELDFGSSFGLRALYFRSKTANPAAAGVVRLASADVLAWRNAANSGDVTLAKNTVDALTFAGQNITAGPFLGAKTAVGQGIPNSTLTPVLFGTVETDTDSAYNPVTGQFTVPAGKGGQYGILGQVAWNGALTTTTTIAVYVGGVEKKRAQAVNPGAQATLQVDARLVLNAADVVDIRVTQQSGGSAALAADANLNFISLKRFIT